MVHTDCALVQVWAGSPAKFLRHLEPEEASFIGKSASCYAELSAIHKCECGSLSSSRARPVCLVVFAV